jgi:competence protein ComEC
MLKTVALSIFAGIVILHYLPQLPPSWLIFIGLPALISCFLTSSKWLRVVLFCVTGFAWAHFQAYLLLQHQLPENLIGTDITVTGYVASLPKYDERKVRFDFDITGTVEPELLTVPARVRLSWYQRSNTPFQQQLNVGDKWQFTVRLKPPRNFANPGAFNYSGWLLQRKILSTGYVRPRNPAVLIETDLYSYPVQRLRQYIRGQINVAEINEHSKPFVRALVIGDRSDMKTGDWLVLKNTGTIHLMAISGLHIGLVAGLVFFLTRILWSSIPGLVLRLAAPRAAAIIAWAFAIIYAALAGFSLPTQRALIMLTVVLVSVLLQKPVKSGNTLGLAVLAVLVTDSFAVLSASFWLSFGAVALIYFLIYTQQSGQGRLKRWVFLQFIISLGLLPLTILFFQQAPFISPVANLLAVPVTGFVIVPLCLTGTVVLLFDQQTGQAILSLASDIFELVWYFLELLSTLPVSTMTFSTPTLFTMLLACIGFMLFLLPKAFQVRALAPVLFIPLLFQSHNFPEYGEAELTALDVGQGLATVIRTKQHVMLFDAGPRFNRHFDTGRAVIIPFMKEKGVHEIDVLLISHGDNDHIGGAESVLNTMSVEALLTSVPDKLEKFSPQRCLKGQAWEWDGVRFEVLHPDAGDYLAITNENNLSCVMQITTRSTVFLLTGDIEQEAEFMLLERYGKNLSSDVMVVPHHGSKTSSSQQFVSMVNPGVVVIPAGWRNRYRFPHDSVLQTYHEQKSRVFGTANHGAITISSETDEISLFRDQNSFYWENH